MKKTSVKTELGKLTPRFFQIKGKKQYGYDKVKVFSAKEFGVKGAKYQIVSLPANASVPPHFHRKVTELFLVQAGKGKIEVNSKEFKAKAGDIFLIQKGDFHALSNPFKKPFVIHVFKWNEEEKDINWLRR